MTAPQHNAETSTKQASTEEASTKQKTGQFTTRQKIQRCWFVTLGLLGGFGFVTSQMSLAMAETDFTIPDYSSDSGSFATGATDGSESAINYIEASPVESYADSRGGYSVSASDLILAPAAPVAVISSQPVPVPEAFIEAPAAPAEVARALAPVPSLSENYGQATSSTESFMQEPEFTAPANTANANLIPTQEQAATIETETAQTEALEIDATAEAVIETVATETEAGVIAFEVSPSAIVPTVTPVAPPEFTQERKLAAHKVATSPRPAPSMSGFMETSTVAAPLSVYSHAQASLNQAALVANFISARSLRNTEPMTLAMADEPALEAPAAPAAPDIAVEVVPDISPEPVPEPEFVPAPAAPPVIDVAPAAEAPIVQPTEIVPAALPEGSSLPEEYNSIFVDPTDYSVGATEAPAATPAAEAPTVVISEQSTGCEFTVSGQGSVPNGACGAAPGNANGAIAGGSTGGYNAPAAENLPAWQAPAPANAPVANAPIAPTTANAPVSYNPSGIQLSTSAAGRDYLNRSVRPLVNLQAAEQFIFPLAVPSPITSLFGFRTHPIFGDQRFHAGTDIGAEQGTPVLAAQDGVVTGAAYSGGYGLMVVLQHKAEEVQLESRYAHLAEIFVESGKEVKKGDIIGLVGSTGNSTGPHLHFEMRQMTADGWVLVNADGLVQASLANLVNALNNPMQTLSFNFSDFNLSNLRARGSIKAPNASSEIPTFPGNNGIPFRPAQPNAS